MGGCFAALCFDIDPILIESAEIAWANIIELRTIHQRSAIWLGPGSKNSFIQMDPNQFKFLTAGGALIINYPSMRRQLAHTNRNNLNQQSQVIEIIPRNDRVLSPKKDTSLERRSRSIRNPQQIQYSPSQQSGFQTNPLISMSRSSMNRSMGQQVPGELHKSVVQVVKEIQKLKSENRQLVSQNQILLRENEMIRNTMEHDIRQSRRSRQSDCSIREMKNGYLESYYTRIKAIQQRVEYYQAESKANQIYSNCLIEISKCLSSEQLSMGELKSRIISLMDECQSYKQEIRRLDEVCRTKEHNTNEELQKIIMDFNETVFIKNELEIRIFDLTTQNNTLRANIYELNRQLQEQQLQIQRMSNQLSNLNTNLSTSQYEPEAQNAIEQMRLNLEHLSRENQHLKMEISSYKTKVQHYHGSEFNHKQQIGRLNNFIAELNTKWSVEFEHNGVLQEERKSHLREIAKLGTDIQRLNSSLEQARGLQGRLKMDLDSVAEGKRMVQRQLNTTLDQLRQLKQGSMEISHFSQNLENETMALNVRIGRLNDTIAEITRVSQNKQNNYLHELNSLREQIQHLNSQCHLANQHLVAKEEEMRIVRQEMSHDSSVAIEYLKNELRLQFERERSHNMILGQKIKQLENRIEQMHKQGLHQESELSSKRMAIADLQSNFNLKLTESQNTIKRMQMAFGLERQKLMHAKNLLQNQLQLSQQHIREMQNSVYKIKESQSIEQHSLSSNNNALQRRVEESEIVIQNLKNRVAMVQSVEVERNRYQSECVHLEKELNKRAMQMELFIKRMNDEQSLRRQSYEEQITSLQQIIQRGESQKQSMRIEYQQQINEMTLKQTQLRNNLMKQSLLLEQEAKTESYFKSVVNELKQQYNTQLQGLKSDLLNNIKHQHHNNPQIQLEFLINKYEQRLGSVATSLQKMMNNERDGDRDKRRMEEWFNTQIKNIRDRCVEEVNKTKRDVNEFIQNEKMFEKNNNMRIFQLQAKIKSYEGIVHQMSFQKAARTSRQNQFAQRNSIQLQMLAKQNETLRHTNIKLNSLLATNQQASATLRNELAAWSIRYDKLKSESQLHEDALNQQIRALKIALSQHQKSNLQLATKATFTQHDRTLDRLTSMPDLNKSLHGHNRSVVQVGKNIFNAEMLLVEDGRKMKSISNRTVERVVSPGTQVVVNVIQNDHDEEQRMVQPSTTVRSPPHFINRNASPINLRSIGTVPHILNQQPTSPTHRICFATKRKSISPSYQVGEKIEVLRSPRNEGEFINKGEQVKIKQTPYVPLDRAVSPRTNNIPVKPVSPPLRLTSYTQLSKPQTAQPTVHFQNVGSSSKPTSPNPKETKLSVTLLHNNSLVGKPIEPPRVEPRPPSNLDSRYCC